MIDLRQGDCLEILPTLAAGSVDAVVTDPPFRVKQAVEIRGKGVAPRAQRSMSIGNQGWTLSKEWMRAAACVCEKHIIAFGGFRDLAELLQDQGQGELRGVFTWRKPNAALPAWNIPRYDTEFAVWFGRGSNPLGIRSLKSMVFDVPFPPAGCFGKERVRAKDSRKAAHPAQKPLKLIRALLEAFTDPGGTVLDPFMGSGTTGVACVQTGRSFIGIELDPGYFEIAQRRIEAAQLEAVAA